MISIYAESVVRDMVLFFGISSPIMNGKDLASTTVKTQSRGPQSKAALFSGYTRLSKRNSEVGLLTSFMMVDAH